MKRNLTIFLLLTAMALPSLAASRVSVRLIEASNKGQGVQKEVRDVADILSKSFVYKSYALVAASQIGLPCKSTTRKLSSYSVTCSGDQNRMEIVVRLKKKEVLNTTVKLRDNKPVILGGFPSKGGKLILVFLAK